MRAACRIARSRPACVLHNAVSPGIRTASRSLSRRVLSTAKTPAERAIIPSVAAQRRMKVQ
ncbi:hypothetical protein EH198_16840 [Paenibacillus rhizophilus]|uniref:Uncharacterized protein n=1 Tax=Paenibacillus rhizophilus TaxID=1850366 RepID=A0A3N9PY23_9BACL|nr:hypothetical protein EH198_16840 [Paenibacillus rhizophilus]